VEFAVKVVTHNANAANNPLNFTKIFFITFPPLQFIFGIFIITNSYNVFTFDVANPRIVCSENKKSALKKFLRAAMFFYFLAIILYKHYNIY